MGWGCHYVRQHAQCFTCAHPTRSSAPGGGGEMVGVCRALCEPIVHAAAHVGGGCKYVRCHVTMHLDYVLLLKAEGHFLLCRGFTQVAKGNPCRNWYINACVYIYICVNKHSVAYQDVDIEHGVLATVMRAKRRFSIQYIHMTPHIDVCRGFSFLGLPIL